MAIILPTSPRCAGATPYLRRFGGVLSPYLGGPEQLINRIGTRWGQRVTFPPLRSGEEGRLFISRLAQASEDRLVMRWEGGEPATGNPGAPMVRAAATGSVLPLKGLTPGYAVREGWFFSLIHGGRRYVHMFAAAGAADGSGNLDAAIFPMLRIQAAANDVVEISLPMIEGLVQPGDELAWEMALARRTSVSFTIVEAA